MTRDLKQQLDDYPTELPPRWDPKPGEALIGRLIQYELVPDRADSVVRVAVIDADDGTRKAVWLTSRVLRELFDSTSPRVGARLGVKRLDDVQVDWATGARYALRLEAGDT